VAEANVAFNLNTAIFEELDVVCGFQTAEGLATIRAARLAAAKDEPEKPFKCPFAAFGPNPHAAAVAGAGAGDGASGGTAAAAAARSKGVGAGGGAGVGAPKCPVHPGNLALTVKSWASSPAVLLSLMAGVLAVLYAVLAV
jgi:hypothetical protein